ncbi:hypothetical protein HDU67_008541 [Dinochytrium kinnereticum]|nr:hypothetical protein HDU67_008541 [Dinochytrium kinnereticum]
MKCHLCPSYIEIHTDPKNTEYVIVSGAKKREEEFDAKDNETMELNDDEEKKRMQDPMYKLEHAQEDVRKAKDSVPLISQLQESSDRLWKDPFTLSQQLRRKFRAEKKVRELAAKEAESIRDKHGLLLDILPASIEDAVQAKQISFKASEPKSEDDIKRTVHSSTVFKRPRTGSVIGAANGSAGKSKTAQGLLELITTKKSNDPFAINLQGAIASANKVEAEMVSKDSLASSDSQNGSLDVPKAIRSGFAVLRDDGANVSASRRYGSEGKITESRAMPNTGTISSTPSVLTQSGAIVSLGMYGSDSD